MSIATKQAPSPIDLTSVRELRRTWNEAKQLTWVEAEYHGHDTYALAGWSDGTGATCTCKGWQFNQRCKHVSSFPEILQHLEREYQATKSTGDLIAALDFWGRQVEPLSTDQRLARGAQREVLHARCVRYEATKTLAEQAAIVARGARAKDELFG